DPARAFEYDEEVPRRAAVIIDPRRLYRGENPGQGNPAEQAQQPGGTTGFDEPGCEYRPRRPVRYSVAEQQASVRLSGYRPLQKERPGVLKREPDLAVRLEADETVD